MKRIFLILSILTGSLLLTGCFTHTLWSLNPALEDGYRSPTFHLVKEDTLISFGKLVHQGSAKEPDEFVIMGEKYIYVITAGNKEIMSLLNLKDSKSKLELLAYNDSIDVYIDKEKISGTPLFSSVVKFRMTFTKPTPDVLSKIQSIAKENEYIHTADNAVELTQSIRIVGNIYEADENIKHIQDSPFEGKYQIKIGYGRAGGSKTSINTDNLMANLALTPFSLILDATSVIMLPIYIINVIMKQ